ncbi:hypothetical protein B7P43_G06270 [Cryptotermes secundus]|uniref:B30.2/SPRY domain-containing protein n=1 Tax=Cryptotermes secundus TaxID=105785 RepID=A0A2J7PVY4_9NEOP|nr:hypothetical protein B7P43_G06270 [Cryptotermes secundus]
MRLVWAVITTLKDHSRTNIDKTCQLTVHEWEWDGTSSDSRLILDGREVLFHPYYSSGTAAVRGSRPCVRGNDYYWEIKVLTPLCGTDVMIGVGTDKVDLVASEFQFFSLLGSDEESWGYSYKGYIQHKGKMQPYGRPYGCGSIIGVHLDMWKGTLQFYLNRKPLGVAFSSLGGQTLYPMLSSTAAKTALKVIYCSSLPSTLQLLSLKSLSTDSEMMKILKAIPFLRSQIEREYWWLIPPERNATDSAECCTMEISEDGVPKNGEDYDSDEDEDESLASFCARMSHTLSSSSQETVLAKNDASDKRKHVPTQNGCEIEPCLFCNQCDTHVSTEGTLSTNSKKLCITCDVII